MRAVDTNVLVRLVTRDDAKQAAAAEAFIEGGAWVSHLVLMEATWILATVYEVAPAEMTTAVGMLLNHKSLTVQDSEVVALALQQFQAKPSLGFSDCLVVEVARKAGHLPLGTFDRTLGKLEGAERI
jgi:predicted nucleic-acid-binding protein